MEGDLIQCPYNSSHIILKPRMAAHLIKCRVQHPTDQFSTCPFNSTHDVPTPELEYHSENCPDKNKLDSFIYCIDEPKLLGKECFDFDLPPPQENWDEEGSTQSYLEVKEEAIKNQQVFRVPVGMSKAERKTFFKQEQLRFNNFSNNKKDENLKN